MLKQSHKELTLFQQQVKLLYLSELLNKDEDFDEGVRELMRKALKKCPDISKIVSLEDMQAHEIADLKQPIEQK